MVWDPGRVATGTVEDMWMATGGRPAVVNTTTVGKTTVAIRWTSAVDNNMILCGTVVGTVPHCSTYIIDYGYGKLPYCRWGMLFGSGHGILDVLGSCNVFMTHSTSCTAINRGTGAVATTPTAQ